MISEIRTIKAKSSTKTPALYKDKYGNIFFVTGENHAGCNAMLIHFSELPHYVISNDNWKEGKMLHLFIDQEEMYTRLSPGVELILRNIE